MVRESVVGLLETDSSHEMSMFCIVEWTDWKTCLGILETFLMFCYFSFMANSLKHFALFGSCFWVMGQTCEGLVGDEEKTQDLVLVLRGHAGGNLTSSCHHLENS